MLSEILKIIPKLDTSALNKMEQALTQRFTKVAKKFGSGIGSAFKGLLGGGIVLGLIDKLLNPLKETQEAIDRALNTSDDLSTFAKQFETTSGKLAKLSKIAQSTGLDQDSLFMLINKFQNAVAQAKANPNDQNVSSVKNYINETDTAEAFFQFINELKKLDKGQQLLVQEQVFGEKQTLKLAEFLQTDFDKRLKEIGLDKIPTDRLTKSIDKQAELSDLTDILKAKRESADILTKGRIITQDMVLAKDQAEKLAIEKENERIKSYKDLAAISQTVEKISMVIEQGLALIGGFISTVTPMITQLVGLMEKMLKLPIFRGIKSVFGGGD